MTRNHAAIATVVTRPTKDQNPRRPAVNACHSRQKPLRGPKPGVFHEDERWHAVMFRREGVNGANLGASEGTDLGDGKKFLLGAGFQARRVGIAHL